MKKAADFRQIARDALKGKWFNAAIVSFVAGFLSAGTITFNSSSSASIGSSLGSLASRSEDLEYLADMQEEEIMYIIFGILAVLGVFMIIGLVGFVVSMFLSGAGTLGYIKYNKGLLQKDGSERIEDVFSGFSNIMKGTGVQFQRWLFTSLWSMLFIIPGIIKGYSYAMAPYILHDNPELTANQAIKKSMELMDGNKWRLFCLGISFIGWTLLALFFTCGIGLYWVRAYQEAAYMAFYEEVKREKYGYRTQYVHNGYNNMPEL